MTNYSYWLYAIAIFHIIIANVISMKGGVEKGQLPPPPNQPKNRAKWMEANAPRNSSPNVPNFDERAPSSPQSIGDKAPSFRLSFPIRSEESDEWTKRSEQSSPSRASSSPIGSGSWSPEMPTNFDQSNKADTSQGHRRHHSLLSEKSSPEDDDILRPNPLKFTSSSAFIDDDFIRGKSSSFSNREKPGDQHHMRNYSEVSSSDGTNSSLTKVAPSKQEEKDQNSSKFKHFLLLGNQSQKTEREKSNNRSRFFNRSSYQGRQKKSHDLSAPTPRHHRWSSSSAASSSPAAENPLQLTSVIEDKSLPENDKEMEQFIENGADFDGTQNPSMPTNPAESSSSKVSAKMPFENFYPLTKEQIKNGMKQAKMAEIYQHANREWKKELALLLMRFKLKKGNENKISDFFNHQNVLLGRKELLIKTYNDAFKGFINSVNPDSTDLIEVLVTATNEEKLGMKCDDLEKHSDVKNEITGNYKTMLITLCRGRIVSSGEHFENENAKQLAEALVGYTSAVEDKVATKWDKMSTKYHNQLEAIKKAEKAVMEILTMHNNSQLRKIFSEYLRKTKTSFHAHILELRSKWDDYFLQTVEAIAVDVGQGRPYYFARLLKEKLDKILKNKRLWSSNADPHKDVLRILLARAQIDLPQVLDAYRAIFKEDQDFLAVFEENEKASKRMSLYKSIVEMFVRRGENA